MKTIRCTQCDAEFGETDLATVSVSEHGKTLVKTPPKGKA